MAVAMLVPICLFATLLNPSVGYVTGSSSPSTKSTSICSQLEQALPEQVFAPGTSNYSIESTTELNPYCVFAPWNSETLAQGIKFITAANSTLAIRGGGHSPITGTSNTNHGVLLVLTNLRERTVVQQPNQFGTQYLRAGPSFQWLGLYQFLDPYGLTVAGGRVAQVGDGALLGGGISFLSSSVGWAVDQVINFELVTAQGDILEVNQQTYPDLFWALKGGGNNYGVVTRYDMRTYPSASIFGGTINYSGQNGTFDMLDAYENWFQPGSGIDDKKAAIMPSYAIMLPDGTESASVVLYYNESIANPAPLQPFVDIPSSSSELGLMSYSELVNQTVLDGVHIGRWNWYSTCLSMSNETTSIVYNNTVEYAKTFLAGANAYMGVATEYVSVNQLEAARASSGDAIDLDPAEGSFMLADIYVLTFDDTDDTLVETFLQNSVAKIEAESKARGLYHPFKWLSNAGVTQRPFDSYGDGSGSSLAKMKSVAEEFDPAGFFQTNVYGFKLSGELSGV